MVSPDGRFWSIVRFHIWKALSNDDPDALWVSLAKTCRHERIPIGALIPLLEDRLWRPLHADPAADPPFRRCLMAAAAGSRRGVPVCGAIRCVQMLLGLPHTEADVDAALSLSARDANDRVEVIAILHAARRSRTPTVTADGLAMALRS